MLNGHAMSVYCLALSHSGTILASGSYDSTTRLWNMDSYEELFVLQGNGGFVNALDFSADDRRLFTGSNDGKSCKSVIYTTCSCITVFRPSVTPPPPPFFCSGCKAMTNWKCTMLLLFICYSLTLG